jgi:hypothetical protein
MQVKDRGKGQAIAAIKVTLCHTIGSEILLDSTWQAKHFNQTSLKIGSATAKQIRRYRTRWIGGQSQRSPQ